MKRADRTPLPMACLLVSFVLGASGANAQWLRSPTVVVANRGSSNLSVIDTRTDMVVKTVPLTGASAPEPMYVVRSRTGRIFVGDRANDSVIALSRRDHSVAGIANAGKGVFHMWEGGHRGRPQLWVNNDVDNTTSVIDSRSLQAIATIATPTDIVQAGGKPHDVFVPTRGGDAYVTYVGLSGASDVVVQFSTRTRQEVARASVGKDPHLFVGLRHVYVPSQQSSEVAVFDRRGFGAVTTIAAPNAHGVWLQGRTLYVTNIAGGGTDGLITIDTRTNTVTGTTDTPFPTPHNLTALTVRSGPRQFTTKIYVTHSGATANRVSVYTVNNGRLPQAAGSVQVGTNPFGLAVVH